MTAARVFHCDDFEPFRSLVREMLAEFGGVEVVGGAGTLDRALADLPAARADTVLPDLVERARAPEMVLKSAGFDEFHRVLTDVPAPA